MPKFVYLFELDSVRKTDQEIEIGQKALYNEIVCNGNVVVLTYNQLVDSRGFFSLLDVPQYYDNIIKLFKNGAIRISQYEEIRTIAQYLINSFDYDKEFIYSGWPLKSTQKRLLALIKRSLIYSDLSEINGYITGIRSDEDIKELFIEVNADKDHELCNTALSLDDCKEILKELYWLIKTVLRLSAMHSIYIPPRDTSEYKDLKFHNILDVVLEFKSNGIDGLWDAAADIIKGLKCLGCDNRSVYIHEIKNIYDKQSSCDKKVFQYAEAIINLVYNYACEISICNISKHYNIGELAAGCDERVTFESDFFCRLDQYWGLGDLDNRFLTGETNAFDGFSNIKAVPDFAKAVRITEYSGEEKAVERRSIQRYEYNIQTQRKNHVKCVMKSIGKKIGLSAFYIFVACMLEFSFQFLQSVVDNSVEIDITIRNIVETIFFLIFAEEITTFLSNRFSGLMSLSEALGGIGRLTKDGFHILFRKAKTYINDCKDNIENKEELSEGIMIDCIKSDAIRKYENTKKEKNYSALFKISKIYPIADTTDSAILKNLLKLEELYNYHFGIVYKSRFNMMCVDPIIDSNGGYFPYERIIPTAGNGVVMVTKHNSNFVLLKQYRHASRKIQISFPRGFGEMGIFSKENAEKELKEELKATISQPPILLGQIYPDSGLTSSCVDVYLVEIDDYLQKDVYEGILEIMELSDREFRNMINQDAEQNLFDDGFTLAAYALYLGDGNITNK